jgi:hypothetical protein
MIPPELATLRDILLGAEVHVTNSETQALRWASKIIAKLADAGYEIKDKLAP